jgi:hypothetical protein
MINQDKHNHDEANNKGALSGKGPDSITQVRSDGEGVLKLIFDTGYFHGKFVIIEVVVEFDLFFNFFLHTDQAYLLVSLGISLDSHHDVLTSVFGQVLEHWVFREVNVLVVCLVTVV